MDQRQLQGILFAVARLLLAGVDGLQLGPVSVVLSNGRVRLELHQDAPEGTPADVLGAPSNGPDADLLALLSRTQLGDLERSAVLALAQKPLPAHAVARRIGAGISRTKVLLTGLADRGILRTGRDGYAVTDPRFVALARGENGYGGPEKP